MSLVKIIDVTYVSPEKTTTTTQPHPETVTLSAFDASWLPFPLIQRLLFFEGDDLPPFPSLLESLRSSLAATLAVFLPLAGKLAFLPSSGDVIIDCSLPALSSGVRFVAAESDAGVRRLSSAEEHDVEAFLQLVPELDASKLPAPALAVQVTGFKGGVAVGVAMHHAVADGRSVWKFVEAWAAACRGDLPPAVAAPTFDRAVIRIPGGEETARDTLRIHVPGRPMVLALESFEEDRFRLARRTFALTAQRILSLKRHIAQLSEARAAPLPHPPSTFVAVSALVWTSFVRSKCMDLDDDTYLFFFIDCRARLDPPVDEGYFGNCISGHLVKAFAKDVLGDDGLVNAALAVQKAVRAAVEDPYAGTRWLDDVLSVPLHRLVNVAASPQFKAYETDFGWGKPSRTELVSMNHDGEVVLVGAKDGDGVQVSMSIHPAHVEAFKSHLLSFSE